MINDIFEGIKVGMTGVCAGRKGTENEGKKLTFTIVNNCGGCTREIQVEGSNDVHVIDFDKSGRITSYVASGNYKGNPYKNFKLNK